MDVHAPHKPIHSIKEFLVHLLAITIGLLIALGLESSVEWVHHRHLAQMQGRISIRSFEPISRIWSGNSMRCPRKTSAWMRFSA